MAENIRSVVFPEVQLFSGEGRAGINFMSQEALQTRAAIISVKQAKPQVIVVSKEEECCFFSVLENRLFARLQGVPKRYQPSLFEFTTRITCCTKSFSMDLCCSLTVP